MMGLLVRSHRVYLGWTGLALLAACSLDREPVSTSKRSAAVMVRGDAGVLAADAGVRADAGATAPARPDSDEPTRICDIEATCDDGDPCTIDRFTIEVESCELRCLNDAITDSRDDDGCCPAGAMGSKDADCEQAVCGNGLRDDGEECDGDERCDQECRLMFDASLVHRYSFDGAGGDVLDSAGDAKGELAGTQLGGDGELRLEGEPAQYLALPSGLLSALTSASVEVWLEWQGGDVWQRVFDFGNGADSEDGEQRGTSFWYLTPHSGDDTIHTRMNFTAEPWDSENDYSADGSAPLSAGELHQVVATFDDVSKVLRLYVDGELEAEASDVDGRLAAIDDADLWIGRSQYETDPPLDASVLELRIYDSALAARAVQRSFERGPDPE
jgi:hypothetical protein